MMNLPRSCPLSVVRILLGVVLLFAAAGAWAATPASQNFNEATGPGISSRIIGDWQFRLLDANGDDDNGGYDFVDIIDDTYTNTTVLAAGTDRALSLIGSVDSAVSAQIRSEDRSPFRLMSFAMDGDDLTYLVTGYAAGLPIAGAVQSFYAPYYVETLVTLTNTAFRNIEEFRISRQDGVADVWVYIDDIVVTNPVASSAAPVISNLNGDGALFTEGGPAARLDTLTAATVSDTDSPDFHGGAIVVGIVGGRIPPQDALLIVHQGTGAGQVGVSGTNVTYGGTVVGTFRGGSSYDDLIIAFNENTSKAAARDIIRRLAYTNTSTGVPVTSGRSISVRLYDGDGGYASVTTSMSVQLNNNPPAITTTASTNVFNEGFNEPSLSVAVDAGVIISDVDNSTLSNATVSITRNYSSAQDRLLFTNNGSTMGNITAGFDTNAGVLTLASDAATATIAQWRAALRAVSYLNLSDAPSLAQRTVTFVVSDGSDASEPATRAININDVNDSPVNTFPAGILSLVQDTPLTFSTAGSNSVLILDPDAGNASIQVALNASTGVVALASIEGLNFLVGTGAGDPIVGMLGHITNINAALEGLTYTPPAGYFGPVTINIYTSDFGASGVGGHQSDSDNLELLVLPPPATVVAVSSTNANGIYTLGTSVYVDVRFNQAVFVDTNGGLPALELSVGPTNRHAAPYAGGSGTDTLTFLYVVLAGHETADLDYAFTNALVLNGGAISNAAAATANLELPLPGSASSLGGSRDVAVDGVVPFVQSITRGDPSPSRGTNFIFHVLFSEEVTGVDASDFTITMSSGIGGRLIDRVTNLGSSNRLFEINVVAFVTESTLRLDLNDSGTGITDLSPQPIAGGFTNGAVYLIDRIAPTAPTITGISDDTGTPGDRLTADTTVLVHGTAESNAVVTVMLAGSGTIGTTNADASGNWTFDHTTSLLPVGTNQFSAVAVDAAGNQSDVSATFEVVVFDNILPTVQSITLTGASPTGATNVTFLVAFSEPVNGIDLADLTLATTGTATGVVQSITQFGIFPQNFAVTVHGVSGDGTLRLDLNDAGTGITDLAGQAIVGGFTNGESYVIDTTAPAAPAFTGVSEDTGTDGDFITADATLILHGTAEAGALVRLSLTGTGVIGTTNADNSGEWTFDYSNTALADGTNVFTAVASDSSTNTSAASAPFTVVIDRSLRLRLLSTPSLFTLKKPAVKVDAFATLEAGERTHFGGGQLVVSVDTNRTPADQLSIYPDTNGGPGIRVSGTNVLWGDLLIAQSSRALPTVSNSVTFAFTTNATPSAVQALVREIAFSSSNASTLSRTVHFALTDGFGTAAPGAFKVIAINKATALPGVTNRFAHAVGTFSGLILRTNDVVVGESGSFQIKITSRLGFSGSLLVAGGKASFSGQFNTNGQTSIITSGNKWGIDLTLSEDSSTVQGRVTAYAAGGWTSDLFGQLTAAGTTNAIAVPVAPYTLLLPSSNDPQVGSGWATVTLARGGVAKLKGSLADGQAWSASSVLGTNGHWPLYASLDKKRGAIIGWLVFSNTTPATFSGTLTWVKPAVSPFFTNGLAAELDAHVSRYTAPVGTNGVLASTNIAVTLANGNLTSPLTNTVSVTPAGRFVRTAGSISNLTFSLNAKLGSFSGTFVHPLTGRSTKHSGVVRQSSDTGGGWFLGTNRGGVLRLNPED